MMMMGMMLGVMMVTRSLTADENHKRDRDYVCDDKNDRTSTRHSDSDRENRLTCAIVPSRVAWD